MKNKHSSQSREKLSILISTDNHLGYLEKDNIRGQDSINTFQEILNLSNKHHCDMILLGGDLFHDNTPSRNCLYNCMSLIRQYTFGEREHKSSNPLNIESDMTLNFQDKFGVANFMSDDFRVKTPIFSIHGNHDDPSGLERLCSLDLLSTSGLVNYFGKSNRVDSVDVHPILLTKGGIKVALYGIGNIRDERLFRTFNKGQVKFFPPENKDEWYHILTVHQNRVPHGDTNYLPESMLPEWMDLVVWGHEHQCITDIQENGQHGFKVLQPGSSVATALSVGEADPKHVFLLEIDEKHHAEFKLIPLTTVRPFIMDSIKLSDFTELKSYTWDEISAFIIDQVKEMKEQAEEDFRRVNPTAVHCPLPLIRLKVTYHDQVTQLSPIRFYPLLEPLVANPKSCLQFVKQKTMHRESSGYSQSQHILPLPSFLDHLQLEDVLKEFNEATQFNLLPQETLDRAVHKLIDKEDKHGVEKVVKGTIKELQKGFKLDSSLYKLDQDSRKISIKHKAQMISAQLNDFSILNSHYTKTSPEQNSDDGLSDFDVEPTATKKKKSTAKSTTAKRGRKSKQESSDEASTGSDDEDDNGFSTSKSKGRGRGGGRGRGRGRGNKIKNDDDF